MSQVIVTEDNLNDKRARSREQEHNIDRDSYLGRWKKATDATKPSFAAAAIGIAALPIIGFWAFILFLMSICLTAFVGIMRGLGMIFSAFRK
jgi:hypothetical protein